MALRRANFSARIFAKYYRHDHDAIKTPGYRTFSNNRAVTMADLYQTRIISLCDLNCDEHEARRDILSEIKIRLAKLGVQQIEDIACNVDLSGLFSQLIGSRNRQYSQDVCNFIGTLFATFQCGKLYERYPNEIQELILHPKSVVKSLALREIEKTCREWKNCERVLSNEELLVQTIEAMADDDLSIAMLAGGVLETIGTHPGGIHVLYSEAPLKSITKLLIKNDTVSLRVYQTLINIATCSEAGLRSLTNSGLLNNLINILTDTDGNDERERDVLLELNALEVITNLAENGQAALDYLEQCGVLRKLEREIARAGDEEESLTNLLLPGILKFFGRVARCRPNDVLSKYPTFSTALFRLITKERPDLALLGNALDTLGNIASTIEGKHALGLVGDSMSCAIKRIAEVIQTMPSESRVRGLDNLAVILWLDDSQHMDESSASLTKSWFDHLGRDPLGTIVAVCKRPFLDTRRSALRVLVAISRQTWGQRYIIGYPGLLEFLLDRKLEAFQDCKRLKYKIIKNMAESGLDVLDSGTLDTLQKFIREGPFHVDVNIDLETDAEAAVMVATRGAT